MTDDASPGLNSHSLAFAEGLYEDYLSNPESVPSDWRDYFQSFNGANGTHARLGPSFQARSLFHPPAPAANGRNGADMGAGAQSGHELVALQHKVSQLVRNYRVRGHRIAKLDPLGLERPSQLELEPAYYGFSDADMEREFEVGTLSPGGPIPLKQIFHDLHETYCRYIGVHFMHIDDLAVREWLQERMEASHNRIVLSRAQQIRILTRLTDAAIFEDFIQRKYLGAKSFSLEGGESLIPLLELAIEMLGDQGTKEIVIGMAHRGRLNVLANIMGKSARDIFREYEDKDPEMHIGRGDVKYHLGYHNDWKTPNGNKVHLALCFNPSHLEFVNPVALGRVRAYQDRNSNGARTDAMAIQIHGDAAFAGEGIIQETLNLSQLFPYETGGSLHVVVNNQIGFTTDPSQGRSCDYATDVAKMLQAPIFHVNGEDPESVAQVVKLAVEFRSAFRRDVVIDMYCYRRRGHNEGDEPAFTQPVMYSAIRQRPSVHESYKARLLKMGEVTAEEADGIEVARREHLEQELAHARSGEKKQVFNPQQGLWSNYAGGPDVYVHRPETGVPLEPLSELLRSTTRLPEGFTPHPKIVDILNNRLKMANGERPLDWAAAEALAYATLATRGHRVRMTGQDCERGTFSHRHATLHDVTNDAIYRPLQHLSTDQAPVEIYNSPLSEAAVLGFEYGYSISWPDGLILWEAQFGDFANAAQVIIDQFLTSAEDKWRSLSGLTLLLPHGFEGAGPEHSSARLERFLLLAAEDNIQIAYPTTPAQMFHLLRRQVVRPWRKPLIVMTPKSLLRHQQCVSSLEDLTRGKFERVLRDDSVPKDKVSRVLLCSGKIYYELDEFRRKNDRQDVAIVRVEQLYPLQPDDLEAALQGYPNETPVIWVQEEPENMGAWRRMRGKFGFRWFGRFPFSGIYRPASASPATGSHSSHHMEQVEVIELSFGEVRTGSF